jgi:hypothetical protein
VPRKRCFCAKTDIAEMTKLFTLVGVGQVHFEHRHGDCLDGVEDRYRRMRIACRVQQYGLRALGLSLMEPIDQMTFVVRLAEIDIGAVCSGYIIQPSRNIVKRVTAVNLGLSRSKQIKIRAIQNENYGPCSQNDFLDNDAATVAVAATLTLYGSTIKSETK